VPRFLLEAKMILVLMGVSGAGKSTVGHTLAERLNCPFADADDYHPPANKAKMASGQPLNDEDRQPWLERLNQLMREWHEKGSSGILACSALKDKYRVILKQGMPEGTVQFVLLDLPKETLTERLAARKHEYMNPKLLDSQLATLERPSDAVIVTNDRPVEQVVDEILKKVK